MIVFDSVQKVYPDGTVAIANLDLEIESGKLTVFVGPSGCGKTTSMRMINRMVSPTAGRVLVAGRDVAKIDPVQLRLGIGYVIQNAGLLPHRTVIDNVATVPMLRGQRRRAARDQAQAVMERVGLDPSLAGRYPGELSGGQQQRVGVARALAGDPDILLMDEPFRAVDPVVRRDLQAEIRRLQGELHKTIVFVTHDVDEAVRLGDRVAVFGTEGRVEQYATPQELLRAPANDAVSSLVGRDRGYRGLSFQTCRDLPLHPLTLTKSASGEAHEGWAVLVDDGDRPLAWIDAKGGRFPPGTLCSEDGSLREALDSVLSSPSGFGLVVDGDGKLRGGLAAQDVMTAARREADAEAESQ